jgi:type II secretory pathway component PulC
MIPHDKLNNSVIISKIDDERKPNMVFHPLLTQQRMLALCALLATLVFFTLFYTSWQWHTDWTLTHQSTNILPVTMITDNTAAMIAAIPDAHLFGRSIAKNGEVPVTNLQFTITGIVKVNNEAGHTVSKAYISTSGQPSNIYQIGDTLPYGVKVYDITPDTVILENNGQLEKLPLARERLHFITPQPTEEHFSDD